MTKAQLSLAAQSFLATNSCNYVQKADAMCEDLVGMRIYDSPVLAIGSATDTLFDKLKQPDVVHPEYMLPSDWLPGAQRVISFFAPFTEQVKSANALAGSVADEWLHARVEGQEAILALCGYLCDKLRQSGHPSVAPMLDPRIQMLDRFKSNWSERHTAFICGLGTFGVSKNLITEKGAAGRFGSIITSCQLLVTERRYDNPYAYCALCGLCAKHCPAQCIALARGAHHAKEHPPCVEYLDQMKSLPPRGQSKKVRYGCGKCQTMVPCGDRIPVEAMR